MSKVVFFNSYRLKSGASIPDFLLAAEKLSREFISRQKGYISFQLLAEEGAWADAAAFETMEDAQAFAKCEPNELAENFYTFLDFDSCRSHFYTVEKEF